MAEEKVSKEIAEKEFLQWCEENELETDVVDMSEAQKTVFESAKAKFIRLMKKGRLVIDGSSFELTLSQFSPDSMKGEKITVNHPDGKLWIGMDGRKDNETAHKTQQAMSALTGKDVGYLSKMDATDWGFLSAVTALFLA